MASAPPPRRRREKLRLAPLIWSVGLHLWFAGVAVMLAWKLWAGRSVSAEPQLFNPSDGGLRSSATMAVSMRRHQQEPREKQVLPTLNSKALSYSLNANGTPLPGTSVTRHNPPGSGWDSGFGSSICEGDGSSGFGPGSGEEFSGIVPARSEKSRTAPTVNDRGGHTVIVLDVSGSMQLRAGPRDSSAPEWEVAVCLRQLWTAPTFNIVCFSRGAVKFRSGKVPVIAENIYTAMNWIKERCRAPDSGATLSVPADSSGPSRLDLGLEAALEENPQRLFLISDGRPVIREKGRSLDSDAILAKISAALLKAELQPALEIIDTGTMGTAAPSGFLAKLVDQCGGTCRTAGSRWAYFREPLRFRLSNPELRPR